MGSLLHDRTAPRIVEEDGSFRTRMLKIASGLDNVIALGRGDPDFHTPAHIVAAAKQALDDNQHHYTGPTGLPQLRQAICDNLKAEYGLDYTADEIIVTAERLSFQGVMAALDGQWRHGWRPGAGTAS